MMSIVQGTMDLVPSATSNPATVKTFQ